MEELKNNIFWLAAIAAMLGIFAATGAMAAPLVSVNPSGPGDVRIKLSPSKPSALSFVEVIDSKTGNCVKTLFAGSPPPVSLSINSQSGLPPGSYRVRYREGIHLAPDLHLSLPVPHAWSNPNDVAWTPGGVYVFDVGKTVSKTKGQEPDPDAIEGRPFIYKFLHDGKLDASFADRGCLGPLAEGYSTRRSSFAVSQDGTIYVTSLGHHVLLYSPRGETIRRAIGGYRENEPKSTVWIDSIALGWKDRLYIPAPAYGKINVYDRKRDQFAGFLYRSPMPTYARLNRFIASDPTAGIVYMTSQQKVLERFTDTGNFLRPDYEADPCVKVPFAVGPAASAGLIWVASHGGPPMWDSDGGELLLFWDTGKKLTLVDRFGRPGKKADDLEFLNPSALSQSPDHTELWVAEDGQTNEEGPPGNARIRRFKIASATVEEAPFEWGKGGQ